ECGNEGMGRLGNSYNRTILWGAILEELSAANIAADMKAPYAPLAREFVIASNPQTILIAGSIWRNAAEADSMRMGLTVTEDEAQKRLAGFAARPLFAKTDAYRTGDIWAVDHGSLRTIADYVFPQFIAKILYPDVFTDLDPDAEIRTFYRNYLPEVNPAGVYCLRAAATGAKR
ncbi:MAG TPA: ABC transporter substrate-binding protein, partial [Candidatus Sutterella merdavium]|nr:ABC transporter substrate-binding protein [Candidatus Sutterella merdavium]